MRILMLTPHPGVHSPLPKLTSLLVSALRDLGCEVSLERWGRRREGESIWEKIAQRPADIRRVRRALRQQPFDLVIVQTAHDWATLMRDIPLLLAVRGRCGSIVLQFHGSLCDRLVAPGRPLFKLASALLLELSDAALVLSSEEQREWLAFYPRGHVYTVRNPFLPPAPLEPPPTRAQLSIAGSDPIVLFVGRLIEAKGALDLIPALAQGLSRVPLHLLIVGEGPLEQEVRQSAARAGVEGRLTLAGYLHEDALQAAYQLADVFVLPTHSEGFPLVILEAMAAGLPVITTRIRGMADHLHDGVNALFVPPRQPAMLAAAVAHLLADDELRARMGAANRETVREFSPARVGREYLGVLQDVLAARRRHEKTARAPV